MLRSRITPCLLLHNGGLVKTRQFKDPKYVGDPLNAVKIFNEKEVDELLFLDIDAAVLGSSPRFGLLKSIAAESRMPLCYGGGVSNANDAARIIALGFEKVSISSAAISRPAVIREIADAIGSQSVVVTIDVRKGGLFSDYVVYTRNGKEKQRQSLTNLCEIAVDSGAGEVCINSIDRDGMMIGYDLALAKKVRETVDTPLSFLGGAGSVQDMQALIDAVGVVGACVGSFFVFKGPYRAVLINYDRPAQLA